MARTSALLSLRSVRSAQCAGMVFASILPQGLLQAHESFSKGYWHARAAEFMHSKWMGILVWVRVPGDIIFSLGALLLLVFVARVHFSKR